MTRFNYRGMSIVEVMIALAVLSVGLLSLCSAIISNMTTIERNREETLAMNAIRRQVSIMENQTFNGTGGLLESYDTAAEASFPVSGLPGAVGRVILPLTGSSLDETLTTVNVADIDGIMRTVSLVPLGMPMDIDFDGNATDTGLSGTAYRSVPVILRVQWHSPTSRPNRPNEVTFTTVFTQIN